MHIFRMQCCIVHNGRKNKESAEMMEMHVCGYRCAKTMTCKKETLLGRLSDDSAVAEFDCKVDKVHDERA